MGENSVDTSVGETENFGLGRGHALVRNTGERKESTGVGHNKMNKSVLCRWTWGKPFLAGTSDADPDPWIRICIIKGGSE